MEASDAILASGGEGNQLIFGILLLHYKFVDNIVLECLSGGH